MSRCIQCVNPLRVANRPHICHLCWWHILYLYYPGQKQETIIGHFVYTPCKTMLVQGMGVQITLFAHFLSHPHTPEQAVSCSNFCWKWTFKIIKMLHFQDYSYDRRLLHWGSSVWVIVRVDWLLYVPFLPSKRRAACEPSCPTWGLFAIFVCYLLGAKLKAR